MEMKYYNPSNNFKAPIPREPKPYMPPRHTGEDKGKQEETPASIKIKETSAMQECKENQLLKHKDADEILLLGLILILLLNGCDDYLLLAILGYIFLVGQEKNG